MKITEDYMKKTYCKSTGAGSRTASVVQDFFIATCRELHTCPWLSWWEDIKQTVDGYGGSRRDG